MTLVRTDFLSALRMIWEAKLFFKRLTLVTTCSLFSIIILVQIVFRYFLFLPLHGLEELAVYSAVWTYFIGGAYGAYERSHISASLIDMLVSSGGVRRWIKVVANAVTVVVAAWSSVWVYQYFEWSVTLQPKSLELRAPLYWVHASMVVGLGLMTFYFALELVENTLRALAPRRVDAISSSDGEAR